MRWTATLFVLFGACAPPAAPSRVRSVHPDTSPTDGGGCPVALPEPSFFAGPDIVDVEARPRRYGSGAGYAAFTVVPTSQALDAASLLYSLPLGASGAVQVGYSQPSAEMLEVVVDVGTPDQAQLGRVHTRNLSPGVRALYLCSWGGGAVQCGTGGVFDAPTPWGTDPPAALSWFAARKTPAGGHFSSLVLERLEVGTAAVSPAQAALIASAAGVSPSRVVLGLGDSRTECFHDGGECWPAQLARHLGVGAGKAAVARWARSGYTCADVRGLAVGALAAPGATDAVVACGINDVMLYGKSASDTWADLVALYADLHAAGLRVVATTIPGARGFGGFSWTQGREDERVALNQMIRAAVTAPATPLAAGTVDRVADVDAALRDAQDPAAISTAYTFDGCHYTPAGADAVGDAVWSEGFDSLAL